MPHPNAAKLWLDFQLTVAGQTILSKIGPDEIKKGKAEWQSIFTP